MRGQQKKNPAVAERREWQSKRCERGHLHTVFNTKLTRNGKRMCLTCKMLTDTKKPGGKIDGPNHILIAYAREPQRMCCVGDCKNAPRAGTALCNTHTKGTR